MQTNSEYLQERTRSAFLWTRVLNIPFWAFLVMLQPILYKEMQITLLQVAIFPALKPLSALFASYWSSSLDRRQDRLVSNLVWANILRYVPFLFFPWIDSSWLMILAFGLYWMMARGVMPGWMELFKRNIKGIEREKVFAFGSNLDYLGPALFPLVIGMLLDDYEISWRWLFFGTALIGLASTVCLYRIPLNVVESDREVKEEEKGSLRDKIMAPWKQTWELVSEEQDFTKYLIGFMFGGAGLIMIISTQTLFFVDVLHLSYTQIALAIALYKGIGFVATSQIWVRLFHRWDIYFFSSVVAFLFCLFPFCLIGAQYHPYMLYLAFLLYGVSQAGSELSWHMSGPVFSKESNSARFSQANVLTVGLRGCIFPFLGSFIYLYTNSIAVMLVGASCCLIASGFHLFYSRQYQSEALQEGESG